MKALNDMIQLFNENNYYRQILQQEQLLQKIQGNNLNATLFNPSRASIIDQISPRPTIINHNVRSIFAGGGGSLTSSEPFDISRWQNKAPSELLQLPENNMNIKFPSKFKWPKEEKLSYDEAQFKSMLGLDPDNLSRDNMVQLGFLNSFTNQLNPTIEDRVRPKYDQYNLNTPVSYSLTPSLTAMTVFNAHDKQGFRDYKRY